MSDQPRGPATREKVQRLVDKLIQRRHVKLTRDEFDPKANDWRPSKRPERHMVPSLWEQLSAATEWKAGGQVTGSSYGSRPAISTGIVAIRAEIELFAVKGADEVSNPSPGMKLENLEGGVGRLEWQANLRNLELKMLATKVPGEDATDEAKADYEAEVLDAVVQADDALARLADAVDKRDAAKYRLVPDSLRAVAANISDQVDLEWWRDNLTGWITQIKANLALTPSYPQGIRGGCPNCGADSAPVDQDGETVRGPALAVTWAIPAGMERPDDSDEDDAEPPDLWVRAIECRACRQTWWRGKELDTLALTLLGNETGRLDAAC